MNNRNKDKKIKMESTNDKRELAKLFLNNLYGKMGANTDSSLEKIPVGFAIINYEIIFTIRAAQKNYHSKDSIGFIYADTDSIYCDLSSDEIK